jgi:predicted GIY-YIG superfamily endonuclease
LKRISAHAEALFNSEADQSSGDSAMDWRQPYVYMLASRKNGTLYLGVTSDLIKRVWQHKTHAAEGFTHRHHVHLLV